MRVRISLLTIALMLALGFTTRYSGTDTTMGLAFARRDPVSVLLAAARLARRRADRQRHLVERPLRQPAESHRRAARLLAHPHRGLQQLGRRDGQDDRRAEHRRRQRGHRRHPDSPDAGTILRAVFWHSLALALLMGVLVMLQAYVFPWMVVVPPAVAP